MSEYISCWDMGVVLCVNPRHVQQSGCAEGMGKEEAAQVAVIASFPLSYSDFSPSAWDVFCVDTHWFMRAI